MAHPALTRAFSSILRRLGEDAVLRTTSVPGLLPGDPPIVTPGAAVRVHREFGVEMTGGYGEIVGKRVVATMWKSYLPMPGDPLTVDTDDYIIDSPPTDDNGVSVSVILRKV